MVAKAVIDNDLKRNAKTGNDRYPVNEVYYTIQGEGSFTGTPALFIRLQGCPVGCGWCDTKYTWDLVADDYEHDALLQRQWNWWPVEGFVREAAKYHAKHVVLTGGEPLVHDCQPLIAALIDEGITVQIETSGTYPLPERQKGLYITCSPKFNMAGGLKVKERNIWFADEVKMPVGKKKDIEQLKEALSGAIGTKVWLQPISQSRKATALCVEACKQYGWKLSIQTHKYVEIP